MIAISYFRQKCDIGIGFVCFNLNLIKFRTLRCSRTLFSISLIAFTDFRGGEKMKVKFTHTKFGVYFFIEVATKLASTKKNLI